MITFVAQHQDDTPAKGTIACEGYWYKFQDEAAEENRSLVWARPFNTDSRGAAIFNPLAGDTDFDCTARDDHGHSGRILDSFDDSDVVRIEVK